MLLKLSPHKIDMSSDPTIQSFKNNGNTCECTSTVISFYFIDPMNRLNHLQFYKQS